MAVEFGGGWGCALRACHAKATREVMTPAKKSGACIASQSLEPFLPMIGWKATSGRVCAGRRAVGVGAREWRGGGMQEERRGVEAGRGAAQAMIQRQRERPRRVRSGATPEVG